jgi:hypothetical protein
MAHGWIRDRDHEGARAGFLGPAHRDSVYLAGRRMLIEEYGGLPGRRRGGLQCVECLTAEPAGPDDVKGHC